MAQRLPDCLLFDVGEQFVAEGFGAGGCYENRVLRRSLVRQLFDEA